MYAKQMNFFFRLFDFIIYSAFASSTPAVRLYFSYTVAAHNIGALKKIKKI